MDADSEAGASFGVGGFRLSLPTDHRLPQLRALVPTYDAHCGWIIAAIAAADPAGTFIDIGANIGDTAAMLRQHAANPIVCVEGNAAFCGHLRRNLAQLPGRVEMIAAFVAVPEIAAFGLGYRPDSGSGVFEHGAEPAAAAMIGLADLVARGPVALLKTDTDGLDAFILRDALDHALTDAVLFFECDEAHTIAPAGSVAWNSNFATLRARGYALIVYDNHGLPMLFAAPDRFDAVEDLRFYLRRQYAAAAVRIHYLDIWAFPPSRRAVFERLRADRDALFF